MLDETDDARGVPVITLAAEVYDAVLLMDAVLFVTEGGPPYWCDGRLNAKLQEFFAVRRCRFTSTSSGNAPNPFCLSDSELMLRMVGG
jgi:hypothetical protein